MSVTDREWQYKLFQNFVKGVDHTLAPGQLPAGYLEKAENVRFSGQRVIADTGYVTFADALPSELGTPQKLYEWIQNDGTTEVLMVSTISVFKLVVVVSGTEDWQMVKGPVNTTIKAGNPASENDATVEVTSIAGLSSGDPIGIILDDGTQHKTTINGAPAGSTVTLTTAISGDAAAGNAVVEGPTLAGNTSIPVSIVTWPADNWLIFTNGVDVLYKYDGTDCVAVPGLAGSGADPTVDTCRWIVVKRNQLFLFNVIESATNYPTRIRYSDVADGSEWEDATAGVLAGFEDIYEDLGFGQRIEGIGDALVLYFTNGIALYQYVGLKDGLWRYTVVNRNFGLIAPGALVALQGNHVLVSEDDIFVFSGGRGLLPLGRTSAGDKTAIKNVFLGVDGDLNPDKKERIFAQLVKDLSEIWFIYPSGDADFPDKMWRYNLKTGGWCSRIFSSNLFLSSLPSKSLASLTWNTISGTWIGANYSWGSTRTRLGAPKVLLCGQDVRQVYSYDFLAATDDGDAFNWTIGLGDVVLPDLSKIRLDFVDILASGDSIVLDYSIDRGLTWTTIATISPGTEVKFTRAHKQVIGQQVRLRLTGTSQSVLESVGMRFRGETLN